jgi:hypothetical protein
MHVGRGTAGLGATLKEYNTNSLRREVFAEILKK